MVSVLGGRLFSTSAFRRRSMKGLRILCSWWIIFSLASLSSISRLNHWIILTHARDDKNRVRDIEEWRQQQQQQQWITTQQRGRRRKTPLGTIRTRKRHVLKLGEDLLTSILRIRELEIEHTHTPQKGHEWAYLVCCICVYVYMCMCTVESTKMKKKKLTPHRSRPGKIVVRLCKNNMPDKCETNEQRIIVEAR